MLDQTWAPEIGCKFGGLQESLPSCSCRATQFRRNLQDLDHQGDGTPLPRTGSHEIVFGSQFIVRADRRRRTMPKPAIQIFDDRRERGVNPLARCQVSCLMNRGSYERVSKPYLRCIELDQLSRDGG